MPSGTNQFQKENTPRLIPSDSFPREPVRCSSREADRPIARLSRQRTAIPPRLGHQEETSNAHRPASLGGQVETPPPARWAVKLRLRQSRSRSAAEKGAASGVSFSPAISEVIRQAFINNLRSTPASELDGPCSCTAAERIRLQDSSACIRHKPAEPFKLTAAVSGRVADDGPAITLYSPGVIVQRSEAASNTERYSGSILSVTVLLSPG